jgi:hypothetical protein
MLSAGLLKIKRLTIVGSIDRFYIKWIAQSLRNVTKAGIENASSATSYPSVVSNTAEYLKIVQTVIYIKSVCCSLCIH